MLRAELPLGGEAVVPRAEEPEVIGLVGAALGIRDYMIDLEIMRLTAPPAVFAYIRAPAPVTDVDLVADLLRDVAGAGGGTVPRAAFVVASGGCFILL